MTRGTVTSINVSNGGVPKLPRTSAYISSDGVEGDRQRNLLFHGGADRAVCLFSQDLIDALKVEGHPIRAGAIGENLTIEGLDWERMVPGARVQIADVLLELTAFTTPCRHIRHWFAGERFVRVSHKLHPGWSRVYARVLEPGTVTIGAPAILLAPP